MEPFVDTDYQQAQPVSACRGTRDMFGMMLAISLALHVISSLVLLSPQRSMLKIPSVTYIDLNDIALREPTAPATAEPTVPPEPVAESTREETAPPAAVNPETDKLRRDVRQTLDKAQSDPDSLHERSFGLGLTTGYFSSLAEGESLKSDIREYYFSMLKEINEKWWQSNGGNSVSFRGALVEIVVARNGMIVKKTLIRSSGNSSFDRSIFQALEKANPLPPLPQEYTLNYFSAPLRFVAPLNLFAS